MSDKQSISKITYCIYETYSKLKKLDPDYNNTLYLVNNGIDLDNDSYTDIFLGDNKVTNVKVINEVPTESDDYPVDKVYLIPRKSRSFIIGYDIYIKFIDPNGSISVVNLSENRTDKPAILVETQEEIEDKTLLRMSVNYNNQAKQILVNIFCVDNTGFNKAVYNTLLGKMKEDLANVPGHRVLRWRG